MSNNATRMIMEQFGDIGLPDMPDTPAEALNNLDTVEVIDNKGREFKAKLQPGETITYSIEGTVLRVYIT
jgi:hypothetical protein|tara:strand:+ start:316 stop:525 length:210 start_codon:yes stop_codon:yes gene_type:complete